MGNVTWGKLSICTLMQQLGLKCLQSCFFLNFDFCTLSFKYHSTCWHKIKSQNRFKKHLIIIKQLFITIEKHSFFHFFTYNTPCNIFLKKSNVFVFQTCSNGPGKDHTNFLLFIAGYTSVLTIVLILGLRTTYKRTEANRNISDLQASASPTTVTTTATQSSVPWSTNITLSPASHHSSWLFFGKASIRSKSFLSTNFGVWLVSLMLSVIVVNGLRLFSEIPIPPSLLSFSVNLTGVVAVDVVSLLMPVSQNVLISPFPCMQTKAMNRNRNTYTNSFLPD